MIGTFGSGILSKGLLMSREKSHMMLRTKEAVHKTPPGCPVVLTQVGAEG